MTGRIAAVAVAAVLTPPLLAMAAAAMLYDRARRWVAVAPLTPNQHAEFVALIDDMNRARGFYERE